MEPVLFYGIPHGCSFGSIVALEWLGQPYRLCRIDMMDPAVTQAYRRLNPAAKTPALVLADGSLLTESLAILNHLAARDLGRRLTFAQGTPAFDRVNRMMAFLVTGLFAAFSPGWAAFKLGAGQEDKIAFLRGMAREAAGKCYARLDALLADRTWLVGEGRTIADGYLAGIARWGEDLGLFDLAREYPNLHAHLERLRADPAVAFAQAIEDGRAAVTSGGFLGEVAISRMEWSPGEDRIVVS